MIVATASNNGKVGAAVVESRNRAKLRTKVSPLIGVLSEKRSLGRSINRQISPSSDCVQPLASPGSARSEERRVGKEC